LFEIPRQLELARRRSRCSLHDNAIYHVADALAVLEKTPFPFELNSRSDTGDGRRDHGSDRKAMAPPPLRADVMESLRSVAAKLWPGAPIIPMMMTVASDSVHTMMAGIPSYGICGVAIDRNDVRMHGKDERIPVESYYTGVEFYYEFLNKLTHKNNRN
jgi:acetylornithine deacetylase/succinyl-diaminopimelate desuccinylase-like protein